MYDLLLLVLQFDMAVLGEILWLAIRLSPNRENWESALLEFISRVVPGLLVGIAGGVAINTLFHTGWWTLIPIAIVTLLAQCLHLHRNIGQLERQEELVELAG